MSTVYVLSLPGAAKDSVSLLSTGAILATFGSAVATLGSIWERDLLERVRLNVDILFKDLLDQASPWRRWPFIPRIGERENLDGTRLSSVLYNPKIPLDVGTHVVHIEVPTVLEDFFDLSVRSNFTALRRFRSAAATAYSNKPRATSPSDGSSEGDQLMKYDCLHDTWRSILSFRMARYATHLGAAITLSGTVATIGLFVRAA